MGLNRFFGSFTSSSSSSKSSRPRGGNPPPLGPGSSKFDYAYGSSPPPSPSTSLGLAHSYYHGGDDAPPAYSSQNVPDFHNYVTDTKVPRPEKTNTNAVHFPVPAPVDPNPIDSTGESPLRALSNRDIVVLLDDSGSMMIVDPVTKRTRWDQAWDALRTLVEVGINFDRQGIDINFMNQKNKNKIVKSVKDLDALRGKVLQPDTTAPTPTAEELERLLIEYRKLLDGGEVRKRVFLVITDGAASDAPDEVIIREAKTYHIRGLPSDQIGIQFIQVGNDKEATKFLEELDNQLEERMGQYNMDIVDTVKSDGRDLKGDALIKALTGGFNRRQDRMQERTRKTRH